MIISTTSNIDGQRVQEYLGIVSGEAIMGANFVRDFFAKVRDVVGGQVGGYEKVLKDARDVALKEMQDEAEGLGATAIIAVDLDYETVGETGSMLMVTCSGTAVITAPA
ncbi:MAG: heavy metal-binding domain-containing protein [Alphaproteobacteria bacterium]|jgi:uncharacterized protein YbjQ (UPF0145 family)|nr:heavy metal-binding domain-containing protein [Alphaproteobacteria bacterium]MBT4083535.1 heavy metal-binding domain-containing protein [Alphaproteobacteria bacterium]MBT4546692.1 heavy metal-binding domain-containing protein [Alphaproteobacteria bacterium]MBT7747523.1 heavy metal-binding domain-containing protein [Alphaproteobacteria bacterium]